MIPAPHVLYKARQGEVAGRRETIRDRPIRMTRRGGQTILVGAGGSPVTVNVPAFTGVVMTEKTIRGSLYGSASTLRDVDLVRRLQESGQLKLDEFASAGLKFEEINEAVAYCASESGARAVVLFRGYVPRTGALRPVPS